MVHVVRLADRDDATVIGRLLYDSCFRVSQGVRGLACL